MEATAENLLVDVTFQVTVPAFTPDDYPVHIVGPFNGWNPSDAAYALTETSPNVWEITIPILDGTNFEHKFTRNSWDRVEKQTNGYDEKDNRFITVDSGTTGEQTVPATVENWRDFIVVSHTPADGETGVAPSTTVTASWNKWNPTPPTGTFSVTGPSGPVAGSFSWSDTNWTHTFTPDNPLEPGQYDVAISGITHNGDNQYAATSFSFTVPVPPQDIYVSAEKAGTTSNGVAYLPGDILLHDGTDWSLFFDGQAADLKKNANVDAFDVSEDASTVYLTLSKRQSVHGIVPRVLPSDILLWDGSAFSFFLEGSDIGLTTGGEAIDGLAVLDGSVSPIGTGCEAYVLVSLKSNARVPGIPGTVRGEDVLGLCATSTGVFGGGEWHMVVDGSAVGMPRNAVYSLSASADGTTLYFTTKKQFNVPPATGTHSMVYTYDTTSGDFGAAVFDANALGLNGKVDGLDYNPPVAP